MRRILLGALAALCWSGAAAAQDRFLGEIQTWATNFCPRGWMPTDGQILEIASNQALFAILGTQFGGDGRTTFALPDLRGRIMLGEGTGGGRDRYVLAQTGGEEFTRLGVPNLPPHNHGVDVTINGTGSPASSPNPSGAKPALTLSGSSYATGTNAPMASDMATVFEQNVGAGRPFDNRQPYLVLTTCINVTGLFPSRN